MTRIIATVFHVYLLFRRGDCCLFGQRLTRAPNTDRHNSPHALFIYPPPTEDRRKNRIRMIQSIIDTAVRRIPPILFLLLYQIYSWAGQNDTISIRIYFRQGYSTVKPTLENNRLAIALLQELQNNKPQHAHSIQIISGTSPEDGTTSNKRLSEKRVIHTRAFLYQYKEFSTFPSKITSTGIKLKALTANPDTPYRKEITSIQQDIPEQTASEPELSSETYIFNPMPSSTSVREIAIKTNLLFWTVLGANIGAEIQTGEHFSIDLPFWYSPWNTSSTFRLRLMGTQPEIRYWFYKAFKGHVIGPHCHIFGYNVSTNNTYRYQDDNHLLWGTGISYGYAFNWHEHWGAELNIGAGYAHTTYDKYGNITNGKWIESGKKNYWGITRTGITLSYKFRIR